MVRPKLRAARAVHKGGPFGISAAWEMFCADHAHWAFCGTGALMIEDRASGARSGACSGAGRDQSRTAVFRAGTGLDGLARGRGAGTAFEAAEAMRDRARDMVRLDHLVSCLDTADGRSCALALRLGAWRCEQAARRQPDDLVFRHFG